MLEMKVAKRLGDFRLEAELEAPAQGVTALFGQSGSGKTSLLRLLAGLDRPDRGVIRIDDTVFVDTERRLFVPPHKRRLGVVFQEARLFPHYRVRSNLTYGMAPEARADFDTLIELLGIGHLLGRMPNMLSGGEARRVAIGRALLTKPRMLLMDEPLTGLDGARKQELLDYIARLAHEIDVPILFVSHDTRELMAVASRLVLVEGGCVTASGDMDTMLARLDLASQLGGFEASSLLDARLVERNDRHGLARLELDDGQCLRNVECEGVPGETLRVQILVRDVALAIARPEGTSFDTILEAEIEAMEARNRTAPLGVTLRIGAQRLRAQVRAHAADELGLRAGGRVFVLIRSVSVARSSALRAL